MKQLGLNINAIPRLVKAFNIPIERWNIGHRFKLPGFSYNDFDRAGHVNIWKILRILETERLGNLSHPAVLEIMQSGLNPVMFANNTYVTRELYERARIDQPITIDYKVTELGTTSFVFKQTLIDDSDGLELSTTLRKIVFVDLAKRKSAPVPAKWVGKYRENILNADPGGIKFKDMPRLQIPDKDVFTYSTVVEPEECDFINHTNQANYAYFALNALSRAVRNDSLRGFTGDVCHYGVKSLFAMHTGESFPDDKLDTHIWRDESDSGDDDAIDVKLAITREDKTIYHSIFTYFKEPL